MERKEYFVDFLVSVMKNSLNLAVVKWRMAKRIILFGRGEEIYRCWSPNKLMNSSGKVWLVYSRDLTLPKKCLKKLLLPFHKVSSLEFYTESE